MKKYVLPTLAILAVYALVVAGLTLTEIPNMQSFPTAKGTINANMDLIEAYAVDVDSVTNSFAGWFVAQTETNAVAVPNNYTPRFVGDSLNWTVSNKWYRGYEAVTGKWDLLN